MKICTFILSLLCALGIQAQTATARWELSDKDNLGASSVSHTLISTSYLSGTNISKVETMTGSNADAGYTEVSYTPPFSMFYVDTKQTARTAGRCISFGVTPQTGHTFKPTRLSFDAAKCGTDGGNFDVTVKVSGGTEIELAKGVAPLRNKVGAGNADGYSHHEYVISDQLVQDKAFIVIIYFYNVNGTDTATPKAMAFRNVEIEGVLDEPLFTAEHYIQSFTCQTADGTTLNLLPALQGLSNGGSASWPEKLIGEPHDFQLTAAEGYTATVTYANKEAQVQVQKDGSRVFACKVRFTISKGTQNKPAAKPLKRGLMSLSLSGASAGSGNLVSWRHRESDPEGVKYKLYRGTNATTQTTAVNSGNFITTKTNFRDASGTASSYYKLEVYDKDGQLLETEVSGKTWNNQSFEVPLGKGPVDTRNGATYTPNDASFCDMDGDGEYEIILKWAPSNEKDAASNGTTSNPIIDCIKLDGTRLWRIDLGPNFFNSAHTIQFIAWDFDGDGYGEFMCKTAPGTIDGEGNYVLLGNDDPKENLLSSRGKQDHGSEYITVFDGTTGAELSTIPYHTDYATGEAYWGDSKQNRSERYLAALAYLDGPDQNPSPIFARGYYSGAFVAAYDFDGETLSERWVHRACSATNGKLEYPDGTSKTLSKTVYGDGAHWISVGDVDGDGRQEIVYGSSCLDHDGTCLYRTGLGHGDALHLGDMLPDNEGLEVLMCHEHKPYGIDIRDARTGKILLRQEEGGDTGRGLAAHFDSSRRDWQFLTSARAQMYNCDGSQNATSWALGSSGAGINARIYWDGDLYDEFFDKSIIAHWNPATKSFDRFKCNGGNYLWGNLNNSTKNNPCVLGDLLGDWREEIVTWTGDATSGYKLYINATTYESDFRLPHLMDDLQYRVQVVNQNCCYNQPPHLSYDPSVRFKAPAKGPVESGRYYIYNQGTDQYLQAGSHWGTRAVVGEHPTTDFLLTLVDDNTYTFDSNISNGGASHFLSGDEQPYVDAPSASLVIGKVSTGIYRISNADGKYLFAAADSAEVSYVATNVTTNKGFRWKLYTRDDMLQLLTKASAAQPADATFLIQDAGLGRNDQRYAAWQWSQDCTNRNNSGDATNYCVESYHSPFTFSQTLSGVPNGFYTLQAQGFYRVDGSDQTAPVLFANDEQQPLPLLAGTENSMADASLSFLAGNYAVQPVVVQVTDGTLTLGVRNASNTGIWAIWDNFSLMYSGTEDPTGIAVVQSAAQSGGAVYDLLGRPVAHPLRGIYIQQGRKIVK